MNTSNGPSAEGGLAGASEALGAATTADAGLSVPDLERVYDALADAIDAVGEAETSRFLVKLALLSADALADPERFIALIAAAKDDL